MTNSDAEQSPVFDYRALRLLVGLVAFTLPLLAVFNPSAPISSISASYYTEHRDFFVGFLFVIGALFWAYNGHDARDKKASKVASVAAIVTAIYPTSYNSCEAGIFSTIHYVAAVTLLVTIAYFCLFAFRPRAIVKPTPEAKRRAAIYLACGWVIVGSLLVAGIAMFTLPDATRKALAITLWVECISLWAFGFAWFTAGKAIPFLANEDERLILSLK